MPPAAARLTACLAQLQKWKEAALEQAEKEVPVPAGAHEPPQEGGPQGHEPVWTCKDWFGSLDFPAVLANCVEGQLRNEKYLCSEKYDKDHFMLVFWRKMRDHGTREALAELLQQCGALDVLADALWRGGEALSKEHGDADDREGNREADLYSSREALCRTLKEGHTVLVDGQWFVQQHKRGGVFLKRQQMELDFGDALVRELQAADVWDMRLDSRGYIDLGAGGSRLLISVSYNWLTQAHPDPAGLQLGELAHFLSKLIDELKPYGKRVAVFLDYASLYQEERKPSEKELFQQGLRNVSMWYGHQCVQVWALTHLGNGKPYHNRGWTTFEWRVALLSGHLLFDLAQVTDRTSPLLCVTHDRHACLGSLASARVKCQTLLPPARFNASVQKKLFTNTKTDLPFVQRKYREAAETILGSAREMDLSGVPWSKLEVECFAREIAPMCVGLRSLSLNSCAGVTDAAVGKLADSCPALHTLSLNRCVGITDAAICKVADKCRDLQVLSLTGCTGVTDVGVVQVAEHCRDLQTLSLNGCTGVTDVALAQVASSCQKLQQLWMDGCTGVTDVAVGKIAENCNNLQRCWLSGCPGVTDVALAKVAQHCRNLQQLSLDKCLGVTDVGVGKVAESCHNLQQLSLDKCSRVTDVSVSKLSQNCQNLQVLSLNGCTGVTYVAVSMLADHCRFLQELYLDGCTGVTDAAIIKVAKKCQDLQQLSLDGCVAITDGAICKVADQCRNLQRIWLSSCAGVTDVAVCRLAERCHNLQVLSLDACTGVTDAAVCKVAEHCHNMQELSLNGCTGVTDASLVKVADNCHGLQVLFLNGCTGVTDIAMYRVADTCHHLRQLSLNHCAGVTDVAIVKVAENCLGLQVLSLDKCTAVTNVAVGKVLENSLSLDTLSLRGCTGVTADTVKLFRQKRLGCTVWR